MHLFAVAFADKVESFMEFYFADSADTAEEMALHAHPEADPHRLLGGDTWMVVCAQVPGTYVRQSDIGLEKVVEEFIPDPQQ